MEHVEDKDHEEDVNCPTETIEIEEGIAKIDGFNNW